jgi:histone-lysine N-methyltransferase SETMAR
LAVLPHPPCSPDLAASDFHLLGAPKDVIHGEKFESDDEVTEEVKKWLRVQRSTWYKKGTEALGSRWHKSVEGDGK